MAWPEDEEDLLIAQFVNTGYESNYAFVNMGMVSGLLPVVGVPLPLVSYGGTALVSLFIGLGVLMSVHVHRDVEFDERQREL